MLSEEQIDILEPCEVGCEVDGNSCDMKEALTWINRQAKAYPTGRYIPPMTPLGKSDSPKSFGTFIIKLKRKGRLSSGAVIGSVECSSEGMDTLSSLGQEMDTTEFMISHMITSAHSGTVWITSGRKRNILGHLLEQCGPGLIEAGYSLQPYLSSGAVSFITVRKGKRRWQLAYAETMSGVLTSTLLGYAQDAGYPCDPSGLPTAANLYSAIAAYQSFLLETFGAAINPTAGMTAIRAARRTLPDDFRKWRPSPLLVAMERDGKGYRGGMTYAQRYRGPATRIDVNREYTACLTTPLPYRAAFGRYRSPEETPHGIFLCDVQLSNTCSYPLSVWSGPEEGFIPSVCTRGSYLSVLHTSEFDGLRASGATIVAWYGYIFTHTFDFAGLVERIQSILDRHGRDANVSKLTKPIGNFVYGKLGQNPEQQELIFSVERPGDDWYAYVDPDLKEWRHIWERRHIRHTSSQHVDVAGTITGAARSLTLTMWQRLLDYGLYVVRCHTDSLTVIGHKLPPDVTDNLNGDTIGEWRVESVDPDTVIVGANYYLDKDGAHISGVSSPTYEMIERLYDGHVVSVVQQQNAPIRGWGRKQRMIRKNLSS